MIATWLNFLFFIGLLFYKIRAPICRWIANRHDQISQEFDQVKSQMEEAKKQLNQVLTQLSLMDTEIIQLQEQVQKEKERILRTSKLEEEKMAQKLLFVARQSAENLNKNLRNEIYSILLAQVLEQAEKILKSQLTQEMQMQVLQDFQVDRSG